MLRITNAKTSFFTSKEHYLAFRKAWADHVNAGKSVSPEQLIVYALLREKPADYGFTPITNPAKLSAGADPNGAFKRAKACLLTYFGHSCFKADQDAIVSLLGGQICLENLKHLVSLLTKDEEVTIVTTEAA